MVSAKFTLITFQVNQAKARRTTIGEFSSTLSRILRAGKFYNAVLASKGRFSPETKIRLINFSAAALDTAPAMPHALECLVFPQP
jgi:hypothetical protein